MEDRIRTKRCEACDGLGRIPEDPELTAADLRAETVARYTTGPGRAEFNARVEAAKARQAARP